MPTPPVVIVPLRAPGVGKTRLAPMLDPDQRAALAGAMVSDVVTALRAASLDRILLAAGGEAAVSAGESLGVEVRPDPPGSGTLDAVLASATEALAANADVLVVPADLPRLTAADVRAVVSSDAQVVLAPTTTGGTGALLRRSSARIATAYGQGSAARHRELARVAGATLGEVRRNGFLHDVDTWEDLLALRRVEVGASTAALLPELVAARGHGATEDRSRVG